MIFTSTILNKVGVPKEKLSTNVANVLRFLRVNKFDMPFIHMYRKEYWSSAAPPRKVNKDEPAPAQPPSPTLELMHLWEIFDLDERWRNLRMKSKKLITLYEDLGDRLESEINQVMFL